MGQVTYIARKGQDADFAALSCDSLVVNTTTINAGAITCADDELITLGTSSDVTLEWDTAATPDQLILDCAADDSIFAIGKSAATQKSFDIQWYANEANGASGLTADASANLIYTTGVDLQIKDDDFLVFGSGAGAAGDVSIEWDTAATPDQLIMACAADDTVFAIGNGTNSFDLKLFGGAAADYLLWDASDSALEVTGDARLDFTGATLAASNTDGGIIKAGTALAPVTEDTADMKFVSLYFDDGATSGDARGIYNRLYITGAGGGGESLRSMTTVSNVAGATAHGAHLSLSFGTSGSVTGQGVATRSTLHMPTTALGASNVTYAALQAEIYSDAATSDPAGNLLSALRIVNGGDTDGAADVDDDCAAFEFNGFTAGSGNMIGGNTGGPSQLNFSNWTTLRIRVGTTNYYIPIAQTIAAV